MHNDYLEPSKEGVGTEEPASSGSTAERTDLRSGVHIKYLYPQGKRESIFLNLVSDHLKYQDDLPSLMRE